MKKIKDFLKLQKLAKRFKKKGLRNLNKLDLYTSKKGETYIKSKQSLHQRQMQD